MGIKKPFVSEIAKNTYAINEFGLAAMYLLVGEKSALLLDTGCGACDLKSLIAELTDKPYQVALTHGHLDHVGGAGAFDEILLGEGDFEMAEQLNFDELKGYLDRLGNMGGYNVYDYSPDCIHPFKKMPKMTALCEGDAFELGNRRVEVIAVPGHTKGGMCFLDEKTGILFCGDACNTNLLVMGCSVNSTLRGLYHLKTYENRYQQMYSGHIGYAGDPTCLSQPESVLDDCIFILESILNQTGIPEEVTFLGRKSMSMVHGTARVSYDPERILDEGEQPAKR